MAQDQLSNTDPDAYSDFAPKNDAFSTDWGQQQPGTDSVDGLVSILNIHAQRAVNNGADPDTVEKKLAERIKLIQDTFQQYGPQAFANVKLPGRLPKDKPDDGQVEAATYNKAYQDYAKPDDISRGEVANADAWTQQEKDRLANLASTNAMYNGTPETAAMNPNTGYTDASTYGGDPASAVSSSLIRAGLRTGQGGLLALRGAATALGPAASSEADQLFGGVNALQDVENQLPQDSSTSGRVADAGAGLLAGLNPVTGPAMFATQAPAAAAEFIRNGGSLSDAYKRFGVDTVANMAQLLGAKGLNGLGLSSRLLGNAAIAGTAQETAREVKNATTTGPKEDFDLFNAALGVGVGALGGLGKEPEPNKVPKKVPEIPKTGDPDIDAGIRAGESTTPRQTDLFDSNQVNTQAGPGVRDMFSGEMKDASQAESNRQTQAQAYDHVSENDNVSDPNADLFNDTQQRTPQERQTLDQDYLRTQGSKIAPRQQAALEAQAAAEREQQNNIVRDKGDYYKAILGDRGAAEQIAEEQGNIPTPGIEQLARNRGLETAGLENKPFEPSENKVVNQDQVQQSLTLNDPNQGVPREPQTDLFGSKQEVKTAPTATPEQTPAPPVVDRTSRESLKARLQKSEPVNDEALRGWDKVSGRELKFDPTDLSHSSIPDSIRDAASKGTLNSGDVIRAWAENHNGKLTPEDQQFGKALAEQAKTLGGERTKIVTDSHNDPDYQRLKAAGSTSTDATKVQAFFDPNSNKIFVNKPTNFKTLSHEVVHAVTYKAIEAGHQGKLTGDAGTAFKTLSSLADTLRPELLKSAKNRYEAGGQTLEAARTRHSESYGLVERKGQSGVTNLHELRAEFFANPEFRRSLRDMKLDSVQAGKLGMGRLVFGKVRNMYEAIRNGFNRMIGVNPKADTAYDALSAAQEHFFNSLSDRDTVESRKFNIRNSELPESREAPNGEEKPRVTDPTSRFQLAKAKATGVAKSALGITSKGSERQIRLGKEALRGRENASVVAATNAGRDIERAMKKESAPDELVRKYLQREDTGPSNILDSYPKTKEQADAFRDKSAGHAQALANLIADDPNSTPRDFNFAHKILDNPGYTFRGYQNEGFTANILRKAKDADRIAASGGKLSDEHVQAQKIVNNTKEWIKDTYLPNNITDNTTTNHLKVMAKGLGVDAKKVTAGLDGADAKRAALADALRKAVPDEDVANKAVNRLLNEVAAVTNKGSSPVSKYLRGVRTGDIMKARDDVPPALTALWGEVKDPASLVISSLSKQGRAVAQLSTQAEMRNLGLKSGWLHEDPNTAPAGYTEKLNGRGFGALQNLYTTPEIKAALNSQLELATSSSSLVNALMSSNPDSAFNHWAGKGLVNLWTGLVRGSKTIRYAGDAGYYLMFAAGQPSIILSHGPTAALKLPRAYEARVAQMFPEYRNLLSPERRARVDDDVQKLVKAGMNEYTLMGEQFDHASRLKMMEAAKSGDTQTVMDATKSVIGKTLGKVTAKTMDFLSLMDGPAKDAAFLDRLETLENHYKKIGQNVSSDDIHKEAMDWIRDTVPTTSRSGMLFRAAERFGVTQSLMYQVETTRNLINAGIHGISDIRRGVSTGDSVLAAKGFAQTMGAVASGVYMKTFLTAVGGTGLAMLGMAQKVLSPDDKRQEFMQQEKGPFRGESPAEISDPNNPDKNNKYYWALGDRNDYYFQVSQFAHNIMDAMAKQSSGQNVDWKDTLDKATESFTRSVFASGLVGHIKAAWSADHSPSWYKEAPEQEEKRKQAMAEMFNMGDKGSNAILNILDLVEPGVNKNRIVANEANASPEMKGLIQSGLGVKRIGNDTDIGQQSGIVNDSLTKAKAPLTELLSSKVNWPEAKIEDAYKTAFKQTYKELKKLGNRFDYAQASGVNNGMMANTAEDAGVSDKATDEVLGKSYNPAELLDADLDTQEEKEVNLAKGDTTKIKAIYAKYDTRQKLLDKLYSKYSKLTPAQIEAM